MSVYPFNDKRLVARWQAVAAQLPTTSWNLNPKTIETMVRHQVATYDHRTGMVSLTQNGRFLRDC